MRLVAVLVFSVMYSLCVDKEYEDARARHYWRNQTSECSAIMLRYLDRHKLNIPKEKVDIPAAVRCLVSRKPDMPMPPCLKYINEITADEYHANQLANAFCIMRFFAIVMAADKEESFLCRKMARLVTLF